MIKKKKKLCISFFFKATGTGKANFYYQKHFAPFVEDT